MIDNNESTPRDLKDSERIGRFARVLLIQILGAVTIQLLLRTSGAAWQTDCLSIADAVTCVTLGLLVMLVLILLMPTLVKLTEPLIVFTFLVNTLACCVALARTGGPVNSLFGPLIPIQLSGVLVLEQQKEAQTKKPSRVPWGYAAISILLWLAAHFGAEQINAVFHWKSSGQGQLTGSYATEAALLTAIGMLFTAMTYLMPRWSWYRNFASKLIRDDSTHNVTL